MVKYRLWMRDGTALDIAEDGTVLRRTIHGGKWIPLSGGWVIRGLRRRGAFNTAGPLIPLEEAARLRDFDYTNGTPRYYVEDNDHGYPRLQVSPGLRDLRPIERA